MAIKRKKLGQILVDAGLVEEQQLNEALSRQESSDKKIGEILKELGYIDGIELAAALSVQLDMPYVRLSDYNLTPELTEIIPARVARSRLILPIELLEDRVVVAVEDPLDVASLDLVKMMVGREVEAVIAAREEILDEIDTLYGPRDEIGDVIDDLTGDDIDVVSDQRMEIGADVANAIEDEPVIKLVNMILLEAIKNRASDIHLEPFEHRFTVRIRIDGVLQELTPPPKEYQSAVISRIKVMADLNIAESRLPQDGRIRLKMGSEVLDFRVSTLPTVFGESVVLRLLLQDDIDLEPEVLGFIPEVETKFKEAIERPNGIILVTGPTGCGKTTTLYAGLQHINNPQDKIITLEDPVEYELAGLIQCQVNEEIGFSFASGLRAILRQDPDICLVGEIRDVETAQIAVQASLTGHLVLSTTHTNEAAGAITRLVDMGVQPFLLTTTIQAIVAQRLLRKICDECREEYQPDPDDLRELSKDPEEWKDQQFIRGAGCDSCGGTGFKGRTGIFEMLEMSRKISELVNEKASADKIHKQALDEGMIPMREDGWQKVLDHKTTIEEVLRVAPVQVSVSIDSEALEIDEKIRPYL